MMLDFNEELRKYRPSLDVDDIEKYIGTLDLSDMNDVLVNMMLKASSGTKA